MVRGTNKEMVRNLILFWVFPPKLQRIEVNAPSLFAYCPTCLPSPRPQEAAARLGAIVFERTMHLINACDVPLLLSKSLGFEPYLHPQEDSPYHYVTMGGGGGVRHFFGLQILCGLSLGMLFGDFVHSQYIFGAADENN